MSFVSPWKRWRRWWKQIHLDAAFWEELRCSHESPPNLDELRALLQAGANINSRPPNTPLYFAVRRNHCTVDTVRFLLENGADVAYLNGKVRPDMPALIWAAHGGGDTKDAKLRLVFEAGADVNVYDACSGRNVLWEMTGWASAELIEEAIRRGATLNNRVFGGAHWEPLHLAAYIGRAEVVKLYLHNGADPSARDKNGQTPRMLAEQEEALCYSRDGHIYRREADSRYENHPECVRLLLAAEQSAR